MSKYSIIVPCYNGMPYIKTCVETILSQAYTDFELVLSEDHSTDGTAEYLDSIHDSRVIVLHSPEKKSMAEHWEWAQSFATGEWQVYVGQDDGVLPYFFLYADYLTGIAQGNNLDVIMSERAYYFWPGCEETYGASAINYRAYPKVQVLKVKTQIKNALYRKKISYMDFPSMYTTSLFHRSFLEKVKKRQNGKIFSTHPQDANLAALVAVFGEKYLKTYIPLGWVGSSVKSAGLAISNYSKKNELATNYLGKTMKSSLPCHQLSGNFLIASQPLYFWGALLVVAEKQNPVLYAYLTNQKTKKRVLSAVKKDILKNNLRKNERLTYFFEVLKLNDISYSELNRIDVYEIIVSVFAHISSKVFQLKKKIDKKECTYFRVHSIPCKTMVEANEDILAILQGTSWFDKVKNT